MSRLSSTATQVPTCLSKKCKCCGNFCTAWDARHGKERSDWLLTTNTLRSDSRWKKPRRPATESQETEVNEHGKKHREDCRRSRRKGGRQGASHRRGRVRCRTAGPDRRNHTKPP